jgi:hypothetical protein
VANIYTVTHKHGRFGQIKAASGPRSALDWVWFRRPCGEIQIASVHVPAKYGEKGADEESVYVYIIDDTLSFTSWHHICRYGGGNEEEILTTPFPRHV